MFNWICSVPVAPLRKEASHRSEMVSQLLFGELLEVLETSGDFVFITNAYDDYTGWCQRTQLTELTHSIQALEPEILTTGFISTAKLRDTAIHLPMGVPIHTWNDIAEPAFSVPENTITAGSVPFSAPAIIDHTSRYLNVPYLWGGRSVFGIDCSGFSQQVFRFFGKKLPRDSGDQAKLGEHVGFLAEVTAGDLAFFDNAEGAITHVGILLNDNTIIHASGKVRIDTIDQWGIINRETQQRTHTLRMIKRFQ
ncbi:MAG: NlpC/P60 family protein [Sediminibacterium sp.]|nr:NlpC/P60 family protein [Sediminibacterium sp.]